MATTAATTTPRSLRNYKASQPPTSALPALPHTLNKKSSVTSLRKSSLLPATPRRISSNRPPSIIAHPATPSLLDSPMSPRKSISINSFPNPPQRNMSGRVTSMPPSPLSTPKAGIASPMGSPVRSTRIASHQLKRPSMSNMTARYSRDRDSGVAFLSGTSTTGSDHLSPPASRSSSAQDSYSTVATTVDAEEKRGRSGNDERVEKEIKGNVIISVRVRPDGPEDGKNPDWLVDSRAGVVGYRGKDGGTYDLDNVFSQNDGNTQVYDFSAKRLVRRVMEGYHGTVFAYGMTGTGKTFSMQGTTSQPGVIPLAITDIFAFIRETPHREFLLRVSYLEIYNERIHDLLATQPGSTGFVPLDMQTKGEEIKLREDPKRGVYATPLKEEIVQSPTQLLKVIARGDLCRRTGSTQYNARSSRSHAVVQIVVESRDRVAGATMADTRRNGEASGVRTSTLSLIDLAGSERAAENKERRQEGAHINRSLLTLGTVIARLSKDGVSDKDGNHLPYRDSKLTRLLQPALAGNSLISILCTIAIPQGTSGPAAAINIGETINTLKFAARAKNNITSQAKKSDDNILDAASKALLERYKAEIQELRAALEDTRRKDDEVNQEKFLAELEEKASERVSTPTLQIMLSFVLIDAARRATRGNAARTQRPQRPHRAPQPPHPHLQNRLPPQLPHPATPLLQFLHLLLVLILPRRSHFGANIRPCPLWRWLRRAAGRPRR